MADEAAYFREQARNCREAALGARTERSRQVLLELAEEFDRRAEEIEAKERG